MPQRPPTVAFKAFVLAVCAACAGVLVAVFWGLDWRWIPTSLIAAILLLLAGGMVENWLHERGEQREAREARQAYLAAQEEHWLLGKNQPR
jgi:membrane protein implicated in regulation of membrane protease activity